MCMHVSGRLTGVVFSDSCLSDLSGYLLLDLRQLLCSFGQHSNLLRDHVWHPQCWDPRHLPLTVHLHRSVNDHHCGVTQLAGSTDGTPKYSSKAAQGTTLGVPRVSLTIQNGAFFFVFSLSNTTKSRTVRDEAYYQLTPSCCEVTG